MVRPSKRFQKSIGNENIGRPPYAEKGGGDVMPQGYCLNCGKTYQLPDNWVNGVYGLCPTCATEKLKEFEESKKEYLEKKLRYELLLKKASKINRVYDEKLERGEITVDEWAEKTTDTEFEIGLDEALEELRRAEDRLIDLGRKVLEQNLTEEQKREIAIVWEYCKFSPIREKVIDVLLRFEP
jgi:predicted  nucleic acid-binding Zn-ribbon protein